MAVIAKQRYKLDIAPRGGWVIVYASRHDDGAREIEFEITNQGRAFSIPASINVSVQGIKSNGSYFSHSCSYSGNIVTMALADDMTDIIGKSICVLKFTNSSQQKLATAKFVLNVDTDSSSEGVIIDTEAEEIFNQMLNEIRAQASAISADIAGLQSKVGTPLVASTASGMTDHNKIYVYVGSESGYTNGNWYYWNGSAWISGGVYNAVAFETDTTLTQSGQPADAKVAGDKIGKIKALTIVEESSIVAEDILPNLTFTEGYYMGVSGTIGTASTQKYSNKIAVSEGDVFTISPSNTAFRWVCAFAGDTAVSASGAQNVNSYTVPAGIDYVVVTVYLSGNYAPTAITHTHEITIRKNILDDDIEAINHNITNIENDIEAIEDVIETEEYIEDEINNITPLFTAGGINIDGSSLSFVDFEYTQKIPVSEGAVIKALANGIEKAMRWICAFSGNTAVPASGSNADGKVYTVPAGIDGVIITTRIADNVDVIQITTSTTKTSAYIKPIPMGYMTEKGLLADGESMTLPYHNVKNNNCYIFNANIAEFSSITFKKENSTYVTVDNTNLTIYNDQTSITVPHGLTIGKNITLIVENETSYTLSLIRLYSDGTVFNYTVATRFIMDSGTPTIICTGSTLSECTFSWVSKNINAPVWLFGDSYFSWYDVRWTYYLAEDGYTKSCLLNAYAGQASDTAYIALVNLLKITTPKQVVWCLGMNNPDSSDAVNTSWKMYYDKIIELKKKYGFDLVLYTVPTTPTMNNNYKNAIIRESGYRYIEADKAVRIDNAGNWVNGALDPDNVHPTAIGAKILYSRILAEFPEIMCNY